MEVHCQYYVIEINSIAGYEQYNNCSYHLLEVNNCSYDLQITNCILKRHCRVRRIPLFKEELLQWRLHKGGGSGSPFGYGKIIVVSICEQEIQVENQEHKTDLAILEYIVGGNRRSVGIGACEREIK